MSAPCPVLGFVVTVALDATVAQVESDALVSDLLGVLEADGLSTDGGGHRVLEYVIRRDGSQATEQDRALVRTWATRWSSRAVITVGELMDLGAAT